MTYCDWWNIKWNTKCGIEGLYSHTEKEKMRKEKILKIKKNKIK